tara:strand:+ start:498 stop:1658 length:1161 start_codon:yes stop_codon:yes gene_type:complete
MALPPFVVPGLLGAFGEYGRQEERNDEIISKIIDSVANKVLNKEIPAEEQLIQDSLRYKKEYEANYGPDVAQVLDAANVFGNPTDVGVENALQRFFGTKDYSLNNFKSKVEGYKKDNPDNFDTLVGSTFTDQRTAKLDDRKEFINTKFSDIPSIRDLIVSPQRKEMTGITGLMFGDRVDKMEAPGATSRLYEATKPDSGITVSPLAIKSELGIDVPSNVQEFMTPKLFKDLTSAGETRFDKDYKSATVKRTIEGRFGVPKPDESIRKSQPEIYAQQKKAYEDFQKLPSGDKENIYRQNFVKDYITKQIQGMVERGVPGAASYQNNQLAIGIAQGALNKISQLQALENQPASQPGESYNADEDIEKVKELARERITGLGLNPEDYGI